MTNTDTAGAPAPEADRHTRGFACPACGERDVLGTHTHDDIVHHVKGPRLRPLSSRKARRRACTLARRHNRGLRATGGKPR